MPNTHSTLTSLFSDIADEIRAKKGTSADIVADNFPDEIASIPSGEAHFSEDDDVCFWDYDGTPLFSFSAAQVRAMDEPPVPPDHTHDDIPLRFAGWNWTDEELRGITGCGDVVAFYEPVDGWSHIFIDTQAGKALEYKICYIAAQSASVKKTFEIDWGDGSPIESYLSNYADGNQYVPHTYAQHGVYHVKFKRDGVYNPGSSKGLLWDTEGTTSKNVAISGIVVFDNNCKWDWPGQQGTNMLKDAWLVDKVSMPINCNPSSVKMHPRCNICAETRANGFICSESPEFIPVVSLRPHQVNKLETIVRYFSGHRLIIPDGVTSLSRFTFRECLNGVRKLYLSNTLDSISDSNIGQMNANYGWWRNLNEITIPATITSVGSAIKNINSCKNLYLYPIIPPTLSATFTVSPFIKIHVPAVSLTDYQTATNWSTFADYMVGDL